MSFVASEIQQEVRDAARAVLTRYPARTLAEDLERGASYDQALWQQATGLGWTGIAVPEEYDGTGLGFADGAALVEELGRAVQSGPYLDGIVLAELLLRHGTAEDRARHLPGLAAGTLRPALALAAPHGAWRDGAASVTATPTEGGWVLDGRRAYVPHADASDLLVLAARSGDRGVLLLVPTDNPGIRVRPQETLDLTRRYCEVELGGTLVEGVTVLDADDIVGTALDLQRVLMCAETVGTAARLFEMTVAYAKERIQFDQPIAKFQAIKHKCADMRVALDAMVATVQHAVDLAAVGEPVGFEGGVAKAFISEKAPWLAGEALQVHGGIGMTWEHDLHLFLRRIRVNAMLYGGSTGAYGELAGAVL